MTNGTQPLLEENYRNSEGSPDPILDLLVGKDKHKISAYVDTGCSTGIFVFKEQVKGLDIGSKISSEPSPCIVADGDIIAGEEYVCSAIIGGEEKTIIITVVDPENKIGFQKIDKMIPLLGRNLLDHYDVLFKGKAKKLLFFTC